MTKRTKYFYVMSINNFDITGLTDGEILKAREQYGNNTLNYKKENRIFKAIKDVVVGNCLIVEEGTSITADGVIIYSNDFTVNESILMGEFLPVSKNKDSQDNVIFSGTIVASNLGGSL